MRIKRRGIIPQCPDFHLISGIFGLFFFQIPSSKRTENYGKSPFVLGRSKNSIAIFNSYASLPEGDSGPAFGGTTRNREFPLLSWDG